MFLSYTLRLLVFPLLGSHIVVRIINAQIMERFCLYFAAVVAAIGTQLFLQGPWRGTSG